MIRRGSFLDAAGFAFAAEADGVELYDWSRTQWFVVDGAAIAALRLLSGSWWRLAACWVEPSSRGQGIGTALVNARLDFALDAGATRIDVFSYNPALFVARGWTFVRRYDGVGIERHAWTPPRH